MIKSVFFSFGINFVNLLFPIILIPLYISVFGLGIYGTIAIIFSILNYVYIITDYSWGIFGPIELNKCENNSLLINKYLSKVINTKLFLSLIAGIILVIVLLVYKVYDNGLFCVFSIFLLLFSRSQNVHWIFIGLNKIWVYFYIYFFCKVGSIIAIIFFIKTRNDFDLVFFILGFADTLLFIISYLYLYFNHKFKYHLTNFQEIINESKIGYKMFLTNLSITSLSNSSTLILGLMVKPELVGIYSVAEKIVMLCKNCNGVLFLGVFPKICNIGTKNIKKLNSFLLFLFRSYLAIFIIGVTTLIFISDYIIPLFSKISISEIKTYIIYLSPIPIITALGQSAYMSLIITEQKNKYFFAYFFGLILNLIFSVNFCYFWGVYGVILALILTELFITVYLNYQVVNNTVTNFFKKT